MLHRLRRAINTYSQLIDILMVGCEIEGICALSRSELSHLLDDIRNARNSVEFYQDFFEESVAKLEAESQQIQAELVRRDKKAFLDA